VLKLAIESGTGPHVFRIRPRVTFDHSSKTPPRSLIKIAERFGQGAEHPMNVVFWSTWIRLFLVLAALASILCSPKENSDQSRLNNREETGNADNNRIRAGSRRFGAAGRAAAVTYAEATVGRAKPVRIALLERATKETSGGATRMYWTLRKCRGRCNGHGAPPRLRCRCGVG
jgi:hypothetical protein